MGKVGMMCQICFFKDPAAAAGVEEFKGCIYPGNRKHKDEKH